MSDLHTRLNAMLQANGSMPSLADEITSAPSDYSDENLARRFSDQHKDALRYVETWGKWLVWDGTRWKPDETLVVVDFSRKLAHEASSEILAQGGKPGLAKAVASARTISAIEQLARADRRHASRTEDWDRDPWLLNTPTGTVDLRTGQLRPHNPNDLITKITAVGPGGDCPRWLKFLNRIFDGDSALISYVQRVPGVFVDRLNPGTCAIFLLRHWRQRQRRPAGDVAEHSGRLYCRSPDGHLHRQRTRATSNRTRHDAGRSFGRYAGNRGRPEMGRSQNQGRDRRRPDKCPLHARRFLHLPAVIQADYRGQPKTQFAQRGRGNQTEVQPPAVHRDDSCGRTGPRIGQQTQGRMAGHFGMGGRRLP